MKALIISGAMEHNLKDVDLEIEAGSICAFCGPSGSGKSSLVFDTIYCEAQRQFMETFSPYVRQFLERLPRPRVRRVENLPAAIGVGQSNPVRNSRSTVATLSEVSFPARMLFFRNATGYCTRCRVPVRRCGPKDVFDCFKEAACNGFTCGYICIEAGAQRLDDLVGEGYRRILVDGRVVDGSEVDVRRLSDHKNHYVIIERLSLKSLSIQRVKEAVETAFSLSGGSLYAVFPADGGKVETRAFHEGAVCPECGTEKKPPGMLLFSFNSVEGACPSCSGFGRVMDIDYDIVIPDKSLSVIEGAIRPLENWEDEKEFLLACCSKWGMDATRPWRELSQQDRDAILFGKEEWYGVREIFRRLESKRYKAHIRILLSRYRAYNICPSCKGARFNEEALSYRLSGLSIAGFYALSVHDALKWCRGLGEREGLDEASRSLLQDLERRLSLIRQAGLGYLALHRRSRTLSGGELSRLCIAKGVSANLSATLYCIDEPSSGLHPADVKGVREVIEGLRKSGNTVLMTENDPLMARCANRIIHLGPGSGRHGGRVVAEGHPSQDTLEPPHAVAIKGRRPMDGSPSFLEIRGLTENNLKDITCRIPMGMVTCVCGVSGSGKSTLVEQCIYRGLLRMMGRPCSEPGRFKSIIIPEPFDSVVFIDQEPASRTPRGCPGTYLKILDPLRRLFSKTRKAISLGLRPGYFSLNVVGGRCQSCGGQGYELLDMQFLPDVMVPCADCKGRRFSDRALEIRLKGKNMNEWLEMTLSEVAGALGSQRAVAKILGPALELGLGHLLLGQPLNTLSAGDSQRLKIARHLISGKGRCLFILDEPTMGLYHTEVQGLIRQVRGLCRHGHTVVVVEHDLSTILSSDQVIELGPGGGDNGGYLLFQGSPEWLLNEDTPTARAIREYGGSGRDGQCQAGKMERKGRGQSGNVIEIKGARHHNLKNIDIKIPRNRLVVVTGVSGSGKSSMAFDLIYKEAQRRYMESLPSYMKQFVRLHERVDADEVRGLSPSVAIEQRACRGSPMSTVATLSETAHYMRLLYAHCSSPVCPECSMPMGHANMDQIEKGIERLLGADAFYIGAPRVRHRKGRHRREVEMGFAAGADFVLVDDRLFQRGQELSISMYTEHDVSWVWGPFREGVSVKEFRQVLSAAVRAGRGTVFCLFPGVGKRWFSIRYFCPECHVSLEDPDPLLFSFHSKVGRCPACLGTGRNGNEDACSVCMGARLSKYALSWQINGLDIASFFRMEVDEAMGRLEDWRSVKKFQVERKDLLMMLTGQVMERLRLMSELGLGYLGLDRSGDSLSGGEAQRVSLASQSASSLTGITVVLDEPTIGLHPSDNRRLVHILKDLSRRGNSVIVVEHDEETILHADFVVDLGPGGGSQGGRVIYSGDVEGLLKHPESRTARGLRHGKAVIERSRRLGSDTDFLELRGVSRHNLSAIDAMIPIGAVTVFTGVSGSGKTSLMEALQGAVEGDVLCIKGIRRAEAVSGALYVDHGPIGRTPRSCPATFIGIFSYIRKLFSCTPAARVRGFGPSHFSFNTTQGACPECRGQGQLRQRLGILPDVYVKCPVCLGKRFRQEVLSIRWKSRDISQILDMTVSEALEFFGTVPAIKRGLMVMKDLGLCYLRLGQPSPSLSGGEAQRLKIAKELSKTVTQARLYLLDEPSVGLHMEDVQRLSACLTRLAGLGNTVVVVEHNLSMIAGSDWIIDLGPGGGRRGGRLLFQGPLYDFLGSGADSMTLEYLRRIAVLRQ